MLTTENDTIIKYSIFSQHRTKLVVIRLYCCKSAGILIIASICVLRRVNIKTGCLSQWTPNNRFTVNSYNDLNLHASLVRGQSNNGLYDGRHSLDYCRLQLGGLSVTMNDLRHSGLGNMSSSVQRTVSSLT